MHIALTKKNLISLEMPFYGVNLKYKASEKLIVGLLANAIPIGEDYQETGMNNLIKRNKNGHYRIKF